MVQIKHNFFIKQYKRMVKVTSEVLFILITNYSFISSTQMMYVTLKCSNF